MIDEKYIIYCVYHNEDLVQKYNLVESEHYKLYYTKNNDINSLNHLQDYFCEFVAMRNVDFGGICPLHSKTYYGTIKI